MFTDSMVLGIEGCTLFLCFRNSVFFPGVSRVGGEFLIDLNKRIKSKGVFHSLASELNWNY